MAGAGKTTLAQLLYKDERVKKHFPLKAWLELEESLGDQKLLLVLDDVWDEGCMECDQLRTPLVAAGLGSKVVVTTRSKGVATVMHAVQTYPLGELSPKDYWSLFTKFAFEDCGQVP
ncbi:putative disease resistance RPP13-like protein 1 [Vitis riparia]|uniref:putative disease resistance RPP13-like protein 1 n=1 Tax=Vitis riparia TaxID=96939 RepID=UPI00155A85B6|nr:putative disease resistance RPP13-like protein 1 [Vitis riparia]